MTQLTVFVYCAEGPGPPLSAPPKLGVVACTCEVEAGGSEVQYHSWLYSARYQPGLKQIPYLKEKKKKKKPQLLLLT